MTPHLEADTQTFLSHLLCSGFELLSVPPAAVGGAIKALGTDLLAAGVSAEPGLLFTAAPKVALYSRKDVVNR